jgi:hypothetical protein
MVAVLRANNVGVGHMERFEYPQAEDVFREVVRLAPNWLPGQINLGIALLNQHTDEAKLDQAFDLFQRVIQREPDSPYGHFCLGILLEYRDKNPEALSHFEKVTQVDRNDAHAWFHVGNNWNQMAQANASDAPSDSAKYLREAQTCFERARKLNPYLSAATYQLGMILRQQSVEKAKALLDEDQALKRAAWEDQSRSRYTEMGRYAEVIDPLSNNTSPPPVGPLPLFSRNDDLKIQLRPGTRWATAADLGTGPIAEVRRHVRARFGGVMVVFDYNHDGRLDLFMLGAVSEGGAVRDLLLRNDGGGHFTDVTVEAGLNSPRPSTGCCVADFDNDGFADLFITGIGEQHLFRNTGKGRFEDVTKQAGVDRLNSVCLGASFVDLDQDGDLDLVVAQYAATADLALAGLQGTGPVPRNPGLAVFLNVGEAPALNPREDPVPLSVRFRRAEELSNLLGSPCAGTAVAVTDLDSDGDLDLVVLADRTVPVMVLNGRLLRFRRKSFAASLAPAGRWNGALALDVNHDGLPDLFFVRAGEPPLLLLRRPGSGRDESRDGFDKGFIESPPFLQAQAIDIDMDGWPDVVGLSDRRKPVLLHNRGGRLIHARDALGPDAGWPADLLAISVADFDGDGYPDLLLWSESKGVQLHINQKNGNHALLLELNGHRRLDPGGERTRCNADGFGARAIAQVEDRWASAENTTQSAGLGQSRLPLLLGLGPVTQPDVLRLRWPDLVWQAEFNITPGHITRIQETNRKETSCPILFAWDGSRFRFVTDFLGAGSLGEMQTGGGYRLPRAEESVKIESEQLVPSNGRYTLKVTQPMDEIVYLDKLELVVVDHPADVRVYPDERFVSDGPFASQDLLAFREQIFPARARDHRGLDVTQTLREWDRRTVDGFKRRAWLGYAEEHWVEIDFGDRLAQFGPKDPLILCFAGWTDYPYPESIYAAGQAGIALQPPMLERLGNDGKWECLAADAGFPAGLPRMMTLDITGKVAGPRCTLRLRTNLQVYWDQIFIAPLLARIPSSSLAPGSRRHALADNRLLATSLPVAWANLEFRGCAQEYSPDGRQPTIYDYDRIDSVPAARASGKLTRTGPVTELLNDMDDCFVIFGPGDEITVSFDASALPQLLEGWKRSYVLRTCGYCKDYSLFTATGDTIEPLPFRGMTAYPYGPNEHYPSDPAHNEYRRRFNTREIRAWPSKK